MRSMMRVAMTITVVISALVAAPDAASARRARCEKFKPSHAPRGTESSHSEDALKQPVITVTDRATEKQPIVIEFEQGASVAGFVPFTDLTYSVVDDFRWFNVQLDSRKRFTGLHVRLEWPAPSPDEFDLRIYDDGGNAVAYADHFNVAPVLLDDFATGEGGMGFEYIQGFGLSDCDGVTIESAALKTIGRAMTLKLWLGDINYE